MGTVEGAMLGRYEVIRHLASGGMADLLLARARGLEGFERHVVIKRIRADAEDDQAFIDMFLVEARLAGALHHHNIVQVHDVGEENGKPYFAMEYVHGEDLRRLLALVAQRGEQIPFPVIVTIVTAVARALHHAHEQRGGDQQPLGIVHRDVSPANIVVGYDGNVKVLDFGIARAAMRRTETQAGMLKGKAPYMAPEQCTGAPVDRRSDVFGLGIVLYELVTARRLFKADNDFSTMSMVVNGTFPKPSTIRNDLPPDLERIVMRALARDPGARFQTAEQMFTALEQLALMAEWRTSASSLAAYMTQMFGTRTEPWLDKAAIAPAVNVDFDGTRPGLAMAPVELGKAAVSSVIASTKSAPIARARADAEGSNGGASVSDAAVSAPVKIPEASGTVKSAKAPLKPAPVKPPPGRAKPKTVQVPIPKAKAEADTELLPMTKAASNADTDVLQTTMSALDADTVVVPTTKGAATTDVNPVAKVETKPDAKPEAKIDVKPDAKPEAKVDMKPDAKPEAKVETKPDAKPEAAKPAATIAAKPAATSDAKPAATIASKADAKPAATIASTSDAKPAAKVETRPEAKPEAKPEARTDAKPEVAKPAATIASKPDAKPAATIAAKPEAAKPTATSASKPDAKPAATIAAKPDPRPEAKLAAKPGLGIVSKVEPTPEAKPEAKFESKLRPLSKLSGKPEPKLQPRAETEELTNPIIESEDTHTEAMPLPPAVSPHAQRQLKPLPLPHVARTFTPKPGEVPAMTPNAEESDDAATVVAADLDAATAVAADVDDATELSAPPQSPFGARRSDPTAIVEPLPSPLVNDSPRARRKSTVPLDASMTLVEDTDQLSGTPRPRWMLPAIGGGLAVLLILIIAIARSGGDPPADESPETAKVTEPPKPEPAAGPAPGDDVRTEARPRTVGNSEPAEPEGNAAAADPAPSVAAPDLAPSVATPDPVPTPEPTPEPVIDAAPAIEPVAIDMAEPTTPDPDPAATDPKPAVAVTKPAPKPAPKPVAKPAPKPVAKPAPKPVAKPAPKPAIAKTKPAAKPVAIAKTKPAAKPVAIAKTKPAPEPAATPLPKPKWNPNSLFPNKK